MSEQELTVAVAKALRSVRNIDGGTDAADIEQEARVAMWLASEAGRTLSVADAVAGAVAGARADQVGTGSDRIGAHAFYLSQSVEQDGERVAFGETLVAPDLILKGDDQSPTLRERAAERDRSADAMLLAARRIVEGSAAHGILAARRGAVNAAVGADNDALFAEGLDAVGGFHYGYAPKLIGWLADRGVAVNTNTLYQWADRFKRRVVREHHSARD